MLWSWGLLQLLFVVSFGSCQQVQDIKLKEIREVLEFVRTFESKFQELQNLIDNITDTNEDLNKKLAENHQIQMEEITSTKEAIETRLGTMEGDMSKLNERVSLTQNITLLNHDLIKEDECSSSLDDCSPQADCQDSLVGFSCVCSSGYHGDGHTCEDINECDEGIAKCDVYRKCINEEGSFRCVYECESPSTLISPFGCITPVNQKMIWEAALDHCKSLGGNTTLLQGITSQQQLNVIREQFYDFLGHVGYYVYICIGLRKLKWVDEGHSISSGSALWADGDPDGGNEECGSIEFSYSEPSLYDASCSYSFYSLCQRNEY